MKVQRASLVFANRLVIELARDVPRDIEYDETHDFVVDAAVAGIDRRFDPRVEFVGGEPTGAHRLEIDERPVWREDVERVLTGREVAFHEPLSMDVGFVLLVGLAPR